MNLYLLKNKKKDIQFKNIKSTNQCSTIVLEWCFEGGQITPGQNSYMGEIYWGRKQKKKEGKRERRLVEGWSSAFYLGYDIITLTDVHR